MLVRVAQKGKWTPAFSVSSELPLSLSFFPLLPSSEGESDFNGNSSSSEVSEGQTSLLEPPACPSPPRRWTLLARSPMAPEESHRASKVIDGKWHLPHLGSWNQGWRERLWRRSCCQWCGQVVFLNDVFTLEDLHLLGALFCTFLSFLLIGWIITFLLVELHPNTYSLLQGTTKHSASGTPEAVAPHTQPVGWWALSVC